MSVTCRICTGMVTNAKFLFDVDQNHLVYQIELLTGEWLNFEQDWPSYICERCEIDLHIAAAFRERCKQTQQQLHRQQIIPDTKPDLEPFNTFNIKQESEEQNDEETSAHEFSAGTHHVPFMEPMANEPYAQVPHEDFIPLARPTVRQNEQHMEEILQEKLNRFDMCERCSDHFTSLTNLIYNICKERFKSQSGHTGYDPTHTDPNRLICRFCDMEFSRNDEQHEQANEQRSDTPSATFERPFKREFCAAEEDFEDRSESSKNYECPHTRKQKYRCELCEISFNRYDNFKRHSHSKKHKFKEETQND